MQANHAVAKQLTTWQGVDDSPVWSPDGKILPTFNQAAKNYTMYGHGILAVITKRWQHKITISFNRRPVNKSAVGKDGKSINY